VALKVRRSLVMAWLMIGTFFTGCSPTEKEPQSASLEPPLIVPRTSVGQIKAGMTLDDIVRALGEPQRRTANALEYTRLGFAVMPDPDKVVQVIMCGDVTGINGPLVKAFTARTREGIGMLSTAEDLLKVYGPPSSSQSFLGARESKVYDALGITFSLEAGKVHHMIVRLAASSKEATETIEVTK
jgi:hypothetical protein